MFYHVLKGKSELSAECLYHMGPIRVLSVSEPQLKSTKIK